MTEYKVEEVIFEECPICKKGKVELLKPTGFFSFAKSNMIACRSCKAKFSEEPEKEMERVFKLDLSNSNIENKYNRQALKVSEWKKGISDLDWCIEKDKLPEVQIPGSTIIIPEGETPHWYAATNLNEERAIRQHHGGSVRLIGSARIYLGQSESHGELRQIDKGHLLLTSKRIIFSGTMRNLEYKLDKVISVKEYSDAIEIGASNRKKVQIYSVDEPHKWAAFIQLAISHLGAPKIKSKSQLSSNKIKQFDELEGLSGKERIDKEMEIKENLTPDELNNLNKEWTDIDGLHNAAKQFMKDRRYKEAESLLLKAISMRKTFGFLYCTLGDLYYRWERYDDAIKTYKTALKVEPDIPYPKRAIEKVERKLKR